MLYLNLFKYIKKICFIPRYFVPAFHLSRLFNLLLNNPYAIMNP